MFSPPSPEEDKIDMAPFSLPHYFDSFDQMDQYIKNHSQAIGITFCRKSYHVLKDARYHCVCHSQKPSESQGDRPNTSTQDLGCGCVLSCSYSHLNKRWSLRWNRVDHNHGKVSTESKPKNRLTPNVEEEAARLFEIGVPSSDVLQSLKTNHGSEAQISDIYYLRSAYRQAKDGNDSFENIIAMIDKKQYSVDWRLDEKEVVSSFMVYSAVSLQLFSQFPTVVLLDATYSTNRLGYHLVQVLGRHAIGNFFTICYVFTLRERKEDYDWIFHQLLSHTNGLSKTKVIITDSAQAEIQSIKSVLPNVKHMLCIWHILRNIEARIRTQYEEIEQADEAMNFFRKQWNVLNGPMDISAFDDAKNHFIQTFVEDDRNWDDFLQYMEKQWFPLSPYFIHCFTDRYPHLGIRTTSPVEGMHAALKNHLPSRNVRLVETVKRILDFDANQKDEIRRIVQFQRTNRLNRLKFNPTLTHLWGKISFLGIKTLLDFMSPSNAARPCTTTTTTTLLLPCVHILNRYQADQTPFPLRTIPGVWRLYGDEEPSDPFSEDSWVRTYHVGDRFQLLRTAKLPPIQRSPSSHLGASESLRCSEPLAERTIKATKRKKPSGSKQQDKKTMKRADTKSLTLMDLSHD